MAHGRSQVENAPVSAAFHLRHKRPAQQERARQVGRDHPVPVFQRELFHRAAHISAGTIHQNIDALKPGQNVALQLPHLPLVGHVGGKDLHLRSAVADLGCRSIERLPVARNQRQPRPGRPERRRDRLSQPPAAARDDRRASLQEVAFHRDRIVAHARPAFASRAAVR